MGGGKGLIQLYTLSMRKNGCYKRERERERVRESLPTDHHIWYIQYCEYGLLKYLVN